MWGNVEDWSKRVAEDLGSEDIARQYRGVCLYLDGIQENEGEVMACCSDLVESNTELMFEGYCKEVSELLECNKNNQEFVNEWEENFKRLGCVIDVLKFIELKFDDEDEYHLQQMIVKCALHAVELEKEMEGKGVSVNIISHARTHLFPYRTLVQILETHHTLLFKLCKRLSEYLCKSKAVPFLSFLEEKELTRLVRTACLFTALKNERARIEAEASVRGAMLPQTPVKGAKTPTGEKKRQGCSEAPPEGKTHDSVKKSIFAYPRAKFYFELAVEQEFIKPNGDGSYKWCFWNGRVGEKTSFVCFLLRVFYLTEIKFEYWEILFNYEKGSLKALKYQMLNSVSYSIVFSATEAEKEYLKNNDVKLPDWFIPLRNFFNKNPFKKPAKGKDGGSNAPAP